MLRDEALSTLLPSYADRLLHNEELSLFLGKRLVNLFLEIGTL